VISGAQHALIALQIDPSNLADQTTLRRAFHTLKGSSRMVGLHDFGEAAWSFEQLLNASLAEQRDASEALIAISSEAIDALERWAQGIAQGVASLWSAASFRQTSDALRLQGQRVPLLTPENLPNVSLDRQAMHSAHHPGLLSRYDTPAPSEDKSSDTLVADDADDLAEADFVSTQLFGMDQPHEGETSPAVLGATALQAEESVEGEDLDLVDFAPQPTHEAVAGLRIVDANLSDPVSGLEPALVLDFPEPETLPSTTATEESPSVDEEIKVIGSLQMSIPLYNVYLNEADEWSRRLQTELGEWAMELAAPIPDSVIALAHALLGSSATVGFIALANMAKALEQALQHVQLHGQVQPTHATVFCGSAEDIRRLLHQFAAGFVKEADAGVLRALQDIIDTEFPAPVLDVPPTATVLPRVIAEAAPLVILDEEDHDLSTEDHLDADLLPIFAEEASELMPQLGAALRQWIARPDNLGARNEVLRLLHTLKGSARLAGAMRLGEMSHRMESSIEMLGAENLQTVQLKPLFSRLDALHATVAALSMPTGETDSHASEPPDALTSSAALPQALALAHVATQAISRTQVSQSVRVRSQVLDRLLNQAGEVMMTRSRMDERLKQLRASLGDLTGNLDRLRQQLRDVELQAESQMQSRLAQTKDLAQAFDPLEFDRFTRVQELTRMMAESVNDVATVQRNLQRTVEGAEDDLMAQGRQARELQKDLLRTRMVEFDSLSDRLYGALRQASKDAEKQVKLDITGGAIEVDRGVLERIAPALEHLLRNAIAHGIEAPEERLAKGKSTSGNIKIQVQQESNDISVRIEDDGMGLHLDRIRAKAQATGLIDTEDAIPDVWPWHRPGYCQSRSTRFGRAY
jgi:chemosensory pili system protein ChpA (sensor histidine kinase/response regulator)